MLLNPSEKMKPVKNTAEILAFKVLNRNIDKAWVEWAIDMLMVGYESEHLLILAGESEPFNQFEMQDLADRVLTDLQLEYSDKTRIINNYVLYLVEKSLNEEIDAFNVLNILKDICIELDYRVDLYDFYSLYYAKEDLIDSGNQWYWDGANRENSDDIIRDYLIAWRTKYLQNE